MHYDFYSFAKKKCISRELVSLSTKYAVQIVQISAINSANARLELTTECKQEKFNKLKRCCVFQLLAAADDSVACHCNTAIYGPRSGCTRCESEKKNYPLIDRKLKTNRHSCTIERPPARSPACSPARHWLGCCAKKDRSIKLINSTMGTFRNSINNLDCNCARRC